MNTYTNVVHLISEPEMRITAIKQEVIEYIVDDSMDIDGDVREM